MAKKFSLLLAAIAVIAFAVPTFANAASVTQPGGEETSTGTVLTGVSHNTVTETALGELSCEVVSIKALLTHNSGGLVTAEQSGAGSTSGCLLEGEFPVTITNPTLKSLTAEGGATPPSPAFDAEKNKSYAFDLDKAKSLIAQSGITNATFDIAWSTRSSRAWLGT